MKFLLQSFPLDEMSVICGKAAKVAASNVQKCHKSFVNVDQWQTDVEKEKDEEVFMKVACLTTGDVFVSDFSLDVGGSVFDPYKSKTQTPF